MKSVVLKAGRVAVIPEIVRRADACFLRNSQFVAILSSSVCYAALLCGSEMTMSIAGFTAMFAVARNQKGGKS